MPGQMQLLTCRIGPFIGSRYIVRCPVCSVVNKCSFDDGDALRAGALDKSCDLGHIFRVRIDRVPCVFRRFVFADESFLTTGTDEQADALGALEPCELEPTHRPIMFASINF